VFSVIIPAHNESAVIERCLRALLNGLPDGTGELIVVCNGCKDDTAEIARRFAGVKVIELEVASKIAALNAGDEAASGYPRAYVDADIELTGADLMIALEQFNKQGVGIVAPRLHINLSNSSVPVKAFYRIWMSLPYFADRQMVGSGVFILSESGRRRFAAFPEVIADDGYARAMFEKQERLTAEGCSFTVFAPKTLADLIKIKTRVRFGNMELNMKFPNLKAGNDNSPGALLSVVAGRPWLLPAAVLYAYVQWQTRRNAAKRMAMADFTTWERDDSSRA